MLSITERQKKLVVMKALSLDVCKHRELRFATSARTSSWVLRTAATAGIKGRKGGEGWLGGVASLV